MNVDILSVVEMFNAFWNLLFDDYREAKMIVLEWDNERRGSYETNEIWDEIIELLDQLDGSNMTENEKINHLMKVVNMKLLFPANKAKRFELVKEYIKLTRDRINYYKNNPEEE